MNKYRIDTTWDGDHYNPKRRYLSETVECTRERLGEILRDLATNDFVHRLRFVGGPRGAGCWTEGYVIKARGHIIDGSDLGLKNATNEELLAGEMS